MDTWYNRYAVLTLLAAMWFGGYYLVEWREIKAADCAAWVQAIGSICAIGVAIYISERQHKSAVALMRAADLGATRRQLGSVLAIIDQAVTEMNSVFDAIFGTGGFETQRKHLEESELAGTDVERELFLQALDMFNGKRQFLGIVDVINRVPMHELGSAALVGALFRIRDRLILVDDRLLIARGDRNNPAMVRQIQFTVNIFRDSIVNARDDFKLAMSWVNF